MHRKRFIASASLVASFMLAAAAISNAFALYTKGANDVSFNIGEQPKAGYYLVGSGSFVTGSDWSTTGGVQMYVHEGDRGMLKNQYLTAGDVFKITNGSDEWYGWGEQDDSSDKTHFRTAYYNYYNNNSWQNYPNTNGDTSADGKSTYYVNTSGYSKMYRWNDKGNNGWPGQGGTNISGNIYSFTNGRWVNDSYGTATQCIFNGSGQSADLDYLSNGNIVVATSGYYDIYLNNNEQAKIYICVAS